MTIHRWLEKPRALAALTLAFALVPVGFAFITFRSARERDARLFATAVEVLGAQLNLSAYKHVSFLQVMRNQWRAVEDTAHPPRSVLPPAGWPERFPHLRAVAFVSHADETHLPVRWQEGPSPLVKVNDNLASDALISPALKQARRTLAPVMLGVRVADETLAVIVAVTDAADNALVRGYLIEWLDLGLLCRDASLPLIRNDALRASPLNVTDARAVNVGEGDVHWQAWITRGAGFTREYDTPTPWLGFAGFALSALPLSLLVMLAARAGKLRSQLEAEREVVRLKTHFLHSVSHEFRTPLSVIQSGAELIEHYADQLSPQRRAQALNQIKDSTRHMNEMVEQVLLLSRIESRQLQVHRKPVRLHDLSAEIVNAVRAATNDRCPIELSCDTALEINSDAILLRGVLSNLIGNAVKYSTEGSPVIVEVSREDGTLLIAVSDHGSGIPADDLPYVCDPFHRGSNIGDTPGTGLGLAIASKCAVLLGGTLSITSKQVEGTRAELRLPPS